MKTLPTFTQTLQKSAISTSFPNTFVPTFIANQRTIVMKTNYLIPALLIGASLQSIAQGPPLGPPPSPVAMTLDRDHDHEISKREIKNAARQLLRLDQDKDGTISAEELKPEPPRHERRKDDDQNPPPAPPPSELLKALDTDDSGDLSAAEIEAASESLAALDRNDDGTISSEEGGMVRPDNGGGEGPPGGGPPPGGPRH